MKYNKNNTNRGITAAMCLHLLTMTGNKMASLQRIILLTAYIITLLVFQSYSDVKRLEVGLLHREVDLTYKQCLLKCDIRVACSDVKYTRRFSLCELYVTEIKQNKSQPGIQYYKKTPNDTLKALCAKCFKKEFCNLSADNLTVSCEPQGCLAPTAMPLAKVFGSQMRIGSKAKYICHFNNSIQGYIQCLDSGEWSEMHCPCIPQEVDNAHARVTISTTGSVMAVYTCNEGYELHQRSVPSCDSTVDVYKDIEFVCCDKLIALPWVKIFRYDAHSQPGLKEVMVEGRDFNGTRVSENCLYRDIDMFEKWVSGLLNIDTIRVDVIVDDTVVAFMEFKGVGSDTRDWFRQDRLLRSSWNDLDASTQLDIFNFAGFLINDQPVPDTNMLIARKENNRVCTSDTGWFAVSKGHYPCEFRENYPGYRILYSPYDHASTFKHTAGGIALADRLEVSVLLARSIK